MPAGNLSRNVMLPVMVTSTSSADHPEFLLRYWPAAGSPSRDSGTALHIDGPLPPGITRQALEQALAARNANADNVGSMTRNAARSISRPGRVTVTRADYEWRQVQTIWRAYIQVAWTIGSTPSGPFRVEVDQLGPGNLVHREEPAAASRNTEFRYLNKRQAFVSPNWYVIWVAAQNCSSDGRCRTGPWTVKFVHVEARAEPESEPWPPPTIRRIKTNLWSRQGSALCKALLGVELNIPSNIGFDIEPCRRDPG